MSTLKTVKRPTELNTPFMTVQKLRSEGATQLLFLEVNNAIASSLSIYELHIPQIHRLITSYAFSPYLHVNSVNLRIFQNQITEIEIKRKQRKQMEDKNEDGDEEENGDNEDGEDGTSNAIATYRFLKEFFYYRNADMENEDTNIDDIYLHYLYLGIQLPTIITDDDQQELSVTTQSESPKKKLLHERYRRIENVISTGDDKSISCHTEFVLRSLDECWQNSNNGSAVINLNISPLLDINILKKDLKHVFAYGYRLFACYMDLNGIEEEEFIPQNRDENYPELINQHFQFLRMVKLWRISGHGGIYQDKFYAMTIFHHEELLVFLRRYESKRCWWKIVSNVH